MVNLIIPPWLKYAVPLALLAALSLWVWRIDNLRAHYKAQVMQLTVSIKAMDALSAQADTAWRATERTWATNAATRKKEMTDEIKSLADSRDALLVELRNRPRRPTPSTSESAANGETPSGATGAQLYQDDSAFLVREAAAADRIRVHLKACYDQYDDVAK